MSRRIIWQVFCIILVTSPFGRASLADSVSYLHDIKPILESKCFACHGALKQESSLRVDAAALLRQGGESGPAIVPGNAADSELIQRVASSDVDSRMPPEGQGEPLTPAQISLLMAWIDEGATAPADEEITLDPRLHWAYQMPIQMPQAQGASIDGQVVDGFLAAKRDQLGLKARPTADKATLLRRVYLDLIGLPPTSDERRAFLNSTAPDAYERVVDRLLASPRYGERWGRHWMDVWRYTDWFGLGNEVRYSQKHIWRWRDWIIESLNEDLGYDQMIVEMLAGDELAPRDPDTIRATGFLARNWYLFNRNFWLDDIVQHSSKAFLGMTFNCARCHDHKYDPITQQDYYRLRAFFEPHRVRLDQVGGQPDLNMDGLPRVYDQELDAQTYLFVRGEENDPDKEHPLEPGVPTALGDLPESIQPVNLPLQAYYPGLDPAIHEPMLAAARSAIALSETWLPQLQQAVVVARQSLADRVAKADEETANSAALEDPNAWLADDFSGPRPDLWDVVAGDWQYNEEGLQQREIDGPQCRLLATNLPPNDFVASLRFAISGGGTRSVGLVFDADDSGYCGVYMSPSGNKVQFYRVRNGVEEYPGGGSSSIAVNELRQYELKVAIRDRLLNVWVDGEFRFAHQLQQPRRTGQFGITTFQAATDFFHASLSPLTPDVRLTEPAGETAPPLTNADYEEAVARAERDVAAGEKKLVLVKAELPALEARLAAEFAKYAVAPEADAEALAAAANEAERRAKLLRAELDVLQAEQAVAAAQRESKPGDEETQKALTDAEKKLEEARTKLPEAETSSQQAGTTYAALSKVYPSTSSGRRLALARWIANRDNPLTARVAVNHLWVRHFGQPLASSLFDFGLRTQQPIHHELLDWLAVDFMESGWSMKRLHRRMVTSKAYRMQSSIGEPSNANLSIDPDNHYLWRMNARRMEAEIIRDSLLHLVGQLDSTIGGPDQPVKEADKGRRRTVYYRYARDDRMQFVTMFDAPSVEECYGRRETIVPQQALAMSNSELVLSHARELATQITREVGDQDTPQATEAFVSQAFERILGRGPKDDEMSVCQAALQKLAQTATAKEKSASAPYLRARENLVHTLLNHDHFIAIR